MGVLDVRSVLEYVPYFRGTLFVVHVAESLVDSEELVDALLDLDALQEIGVKLVLIAENDRAASLYDRSRRCEMRSACVQASLSAGACAVERVREILGRNQVPVVSSGACGNFDELSVQLAVDLKAVKYIALMDGNIPMRGGKPIFSILEREVSQAADVTHADVLEMAAEVCRRGIARVHLLDGRRRGVLVDELFSEEGVGTMVHTDSYREIRPLEEEDIPELLSMIARSVVDAKLVDRTYEDILARLDAYSVFTLDGSIVGCVALYPYPDDDCAELGCLYIKYDYAGHGYGRALCQFVEKKAKDLGFSHIFAVSRSAVEYFRDHLHYAELSRDVLPAARRRALELSGRSSGVFGREL